MTVRAIGGTTGEIHRIYCEECQRHTAHANDLTFTHAVGVGLALSIVTCGLALPFVLYALWKHPANAYVCSYCGTKNPMEPK